MTVYSELWLIYGLIFGAVLLGLQALYWILFKGRRDEKAINRRLLLTTRFGNPNEVLEVLRRERGLEIIADIPAFDGINRLIVQSGVKLTPVSLLLLTVPLGVLYYAVLVLATRSSLLATCLAAPAVAVSIYMFLRVARSRRIAAFGDQFPDALDVIVRGLRAGHPFRVALGLAAREMPDPVGSEFGVVADEIMFGQDQDRAIEALGQRVGYPDLSFFATAVSVQHQTGGNLAEILSRLSHLLRSRLKLRLKIRALSSEGRLSAIALSLAPFVLFGIVTLVSPDYFGSVKDHPIMQMGAAVGLFLILVGNIVMYRMVNFKF